MDIDKTGGVRPGDPSTSHEAAMDTNATQLENIAYAVLKADGGWMNYFQWSEASGIKYASITPRGKSLWLAGRIIREKRVGVNDLGKITNLLHFKAI